MRQPKSDTEGTEQQTGGSRARAPRRPSEPEYFFYLMPEGKRGPRLSKGKCPADDDPELYIEESSQCEPGLYRIEKRKGGEIQGQVYYFTKEEDAARSATGKEEDDDAGEGFEDLDDLDERVARTVVAVLDARERRERPTTPQLNPLDIAREVEQLAEQRAARDREVRESILREIEARTPKVDPAASQPPQLDPQTQLGVLLLKESGTLKGLFRNVREAFGAVERVDEPTSWPERLADLAREYAPYVGPVAGPIIGQLIVKAAAQQGGLIPPPVAPQQQPPAGQQAAPTADVQAAALQVLNVAVSELKRNKRVGRTADAIDELVTAHPEIGGDIGNLLRMPAAQVLAQLSQVAGEDLSSYSHAHEWVEALASEVLPDEDEEGADEPQVQPEANGHKASDAGVTM